MFSPDKTAKMASPEKSKPVKENLAESFFSGFSITKGNNPTQTNEVSDTATVPSTDVEDVISTASVSAQPPQVEPRPILETNLSTATPGHTESGEMNDTPATDDAQTADTAQDLTTPRKPRKRADGTASAKKTPAPSPAITISPAVQAKVTLYTTELETLLKAGPAGYIQADIPTDVSHPLECSDPHSKLFFFPQSAHVLSIAHQIRRSPATLLKLSGFRAPQPNSEHALSSEHLPLVARLAQDSTLPLKQLAVQLYHILYAQPWGEVVDAIMNARQAHAEATEDIAEMRRCAEGTRTENSEMSDKDSASPLVPSIPLSQVCGPAQPSAMALVHLESAIGLACERKWYGLPGGAQSLLRDSKAKKGKKEREEEDEDGIEGASVWEAVGASDNWDSEKSRINAHRRVRKGFEGLVKAYRSYIEAVWKGAADSKLDNLDEKVVKGKRERVEFVAKWTKEREKEEEREKKALEAQREREKKQREREEKEREKERERQEKEAAKDASKKALEEKKKEEEEKRRRANATFMSKFLQKATPATPTTTLTKANTDESAKATPSSVVATDLVATPTSNKNKQSMRFRPYQLPSHAWCAPKPSQPGFRKKHAILPEIPCSSELFKQSLRKRFAAVSARRRQREERRRAREAEALAAAASTANVSVIAKKTEHETRGDKHAVLLVATVQQPHATITRNTQPSTATGTATDTATVTSTTASLPSSTSATADMCVDLDVLSQEAAASEPLATLDLTGPTTVSHTATSSSSDVVILGTNLPTTTVADKMDDAPIPVKTRRLPPSQRPKLLQFVENRVRPPWYGPWPRGVSGFPLANPTTENPTQVITRILPRRPLCSYPHVCYTEDSEDEWEAGSDDESVDKDDDSEEEESESEAEEGFLEEGDIDKKSVSDVPPSLLGPFLPVVNIPTATTTVHFTAHNLLKPGALIPMMSTKERLGVVVAGFPEELERYLPRVQAATVPMVTFETSAKRRKRAKRAKNKAKGKAADDAIVSLSKTDPQTAMSDNATSISSVPTNPAPVASGEPAPVAVLAVRRKVAPVLVQPVDAPAADTPVPPPSAAPVVAVVDTTADMTADKPVDAAVCGVEEPRVDNSSLGETVMLAPVRRRITPALITENSDNIAAKDDSAIESEDAMKDDVAQ